MVYFRIQGPLKTKYRGPGDEANTNQACQCHSTLFVSLTALPVLRDEDPDTGSTQLIPVPVLVTNYRTTFREPVNEGDDVDRWQLVRRFYLAQAITGVPQYAREMELV